MILKKCFLILILAIAANKLCAQDSLQQTITKKISPSDRVIIDLNGAVLSKKIWQNLLMSGEYGLKSFSGDTMMLYQLSDKDKKSREARIADMPMPQESRAFYNGDKFTRIKTKDIYGNKINTKDLKGKIIVINYWFINCPPCRLEIPELNKIVADYKSDTSVVFIAIALDDVDEIADFISSQPFHYTLIGEGKYLDDSYKIKGYPTNLVIDKEGKVYFNSMGFGPNTVFWIRKSIEEIKQKTVE